MIIHALNWKRLGEKKKARVSWVWSMAYVILLLALDAYLSLKTSANHHDANAIFMLTNVFMTIFWHFISGQSQSDYIINNLGGQYNRERWAVPIGVALTIKITSYFLEN